MARPWNTSLHVKQWKLRLLRLRLGLSMQQFGEIVGYSTEAIRKIELGLEKPREKRKMKMLRNLILYIRSREDGDAIYKSVVSYERT